MFNGRKTKEDRIYELEAVVQAHLAMCETDKKNKEKAFDEYKKLVMDSFASIAKRFSRIEVLLVGILLSMVGFALEKFFTSAKITFGGP